MSTQSPEEPATPEQIAKEAQRIIEAAPAHGPYMPTDYAKALPASASELASLLRSPEMVQLVEQYHEADRIAGRAQTWNRLLTQIAAATGFCAGALGGVYLIVGASVQGVVEVAFCLSAIALLSLLSAFFFKPLRIWRVRRLEAETLRLKIFDVIVESAERARGRMSLAVAFECFRRHLFEDQMNWFQRRAKDKQREARRWRTIGWIGALFTAMGSMPQAFAFVDAMDNGWLYDLLHQLASWLPKEKKLYAYFSFLGFQLTPLLAVIAMVYKSSDLAKTYAREFRFLKRYERYLSSARQAAANGEPASVHMFAQIVLTRLGEGVEEWAKGAKIEPK
jgi:hypothetical protein